MVAPLVFTFLSRKWILFGFFSLLGLGVIVVGFRCRAMELGFDVGSAERHRVVFRFNRLWGAVSLDVDDEPVVRDMRIFSVRHTRKYFLSVGTAERHEVRIERDLVLAGVRQPVRAYVDDILVAEAVA